MLPNMNFTNTQFKTANTKLIKLEVKYPISVSLNLHFCMHIPNGFQKGTIPLDDIITLFLNRH